MLQLVAPVQALAMMSVAMLPAAGEEVLGQSTYDRLDVTNLDLTGAGLGAG